MFSKRYRTGIDRNDYFNVFITVLYLAESILMSSGPSLDIEKPLLGSSNCIEEAPTSNKTPSSECLVIPFSDTRWWTSLNRPTSGVNRGLKGNGLQKCSCREIWFLSLRGVCVI